MSKRTAEVKNDWVPRTLYDQEVATLTDRCVAAEGCVVDLLNMIDPELLERHGFDWLAATESLRCA